MISHACDIIRRSSRRRRHRWDRASKSPALPTIPEASVASTVERGRSISKHHRQGLKHEHHKYRLGARQLQLCMVVFIPGHFIFTTILLLHPSFLRPRSLRPRPLLRRLDSEYYETKERVIDLSNELHVPRKNANSIPIQQDKKIEYSATMSTKRIVVLSSTFDTPSYWNLDKMAKDAEDLNQPHSIDSANDKVKLQYALSQQDDGSAKTDCTPMAKWQTMSFPTCNLLHEMNVFSSSSTLSHFDQRQQRNKVLLHNEKKMSNVAEKIVSVSDTYMTRILGNGWFRHAWEIVDAYHGESMAVKTLRLEREFLSEYYELHRRDAVAMERLTSSPYVMDIYGYCGQSAMTELAHSEKGINNLYRLSTGLQGVNTPYALQTKLQIAAMISLGLSHIHNVARDDEDGDQRANQLATIAHYDINPRNIIMTPSGRPKLNDFNVAEFLTWDPKTRSQQLCGFESRLHEPWWRAPEEMTVYNKTTDDEAIEVYPKAKISEKVDVYSLGNTLYVLLTGLEPRGKEHKKLRLHNVSNVLAHGEYPSFPEEYENSSDPAIRAIIHAIKLCWTPGPANRPTSAEISEGLFDALDYIKQHGK